MSEAPDETTWTIGGQHLAVVRPPDIVRLTIHGDVSGPDVRGIFNMLNAVAPALATPFFLLTDLTRMGAFSAEGRRLSASPQTLPPCVMLIFGASRLQRTMIQLINRAYLLLTRDPAPAEVIFLGSEAEALRWIEERRRSREGRA